MKTGWPIKTLDEVCQFRGGGTPSKAVERYWKGDIPWVSPKDMKFDVVSDSIDHISQEAIQSSATSLIPKDSVLMVVRSGILARTVPLAITGRDLTINQDLKALCPNGAIDARFLYHLLDSKMDALLAMVSRGATVHRLMTDQIRSIEFALPPLPEQQRIVGILDEAFDGIATANANAEQNLQNARALFESHLQSVFTRRDEGWVEKPLEAVAAILNGYAFKSTSFSTKESVKCIKITNVGVREFVCESDGYLPSSFAEEYHAVSVEKGNIVIALTRTIIAGGLKVAVVPEAYDGALLNQRVAAIRPNEKVLSPAFLFAYLSTQAVTRYVTGRVNTLMQPNLSIADLRSMPIPMPSCLQQDEITGQLEVLREETQRLESIYQQKLAALDELKKSLLHQAFTGQL